MGNLVATYFGNTNRSNDAVTGVYLHIAPPICKNLNNQIVSGFTSVFFIMALRLIISGNALFVLINQ